MSITEKQQIAKGQEKYIIKIIKLAKQEERQRCIEIVRSHIAPTYPINCKAIIKEIKEIK